VDRHQLGGQEGVIAVVDHDDAVVGSLSPQFVKKTCRIDQIGGVVPVPALAIG
jgi:hypothetical protein